MFPPHILGRKIKPAKGASDEGIDWFMKIYPRVKDDPELEMIEVRSFRARACLCSSFERGGGVSDPDVLPC